MDYLESFSSRDALSGFVGGFLLPAAAKIASWNPNNGLEQIFGLNIIPVFLIGFILAAVSSHAWRYNIRWVLPASVLPVSAPFLLRYCVGSCLMNYQLFYWMSLASAFTIYLSVILHRHRKLLKEFVRGGEKGIHRQLGISLGAGIIYYAVFLLINIAVRWSIISDNAVYRVSAVVLSLGLIPAAAIMVWLYLRKKLKTPVLVHLLWIGIWCMAILPSLEYIPLGHFYSISYIAPATDYILTWPSLLALTILAAIIETKLRNIDLKNYSVIPVRL